MFICFILPCRAKPTIVSFNINCQQMFFSPNLIYGIQPSSNPLRSRLQYLGLEFEGRQHSGIADSRNITRLVQQMVLQGCTFGCTQRLVEKGFELKARTGDQGTFRRYFERINAGHGAFSGGGPGGSGARGGQGGPSGTGGPGGRAKQSTMTQYLQARRMNEQNEGSGRPNGATGNNQVGARGGPSQMGAPDDEDENIDDLMSWLSMSRR